MNGTSSPIVTQTLSTIEAPEPEVATSDSAPEAPPATPPAEGAPGAESGAAATDPKTDPHLDLAKKFESVAAKESRVRKADREAQQKLAALTEREKKLAEREAELEEALGDPVGHMLKIGKDPVEVAKRYAEPETPAEKRIRKLEEQIAERAEADAKRQAEWETKQKEQAKLNVFREFVGSITTKECPNLTALYEAREVPGLVEELLHRPVDPADSSSLTMIQAFQEQRGRNPTDQEIRECLEYEAELRATKILERHRSAQAPDPSVATSSGDEAQGTPKSEAGPNGISNKHAATTSSGGKRPLSFEERRKQARKELTAALEAEAGDE